MEHIGIDLGSSKSAICIACETGVLLLETTVRTLELESFLAKRPASRVVLESCAESRRVAQRALELGHEARIIPTSFVRSLGIGSRNIKNDKRDARNIVMASIRLGDELPHVHIRSDEMVAIQDVVRARSSLVSQRTMAINFVRAQLRKELLGRGPRATPLTFSKQVRELVGDNHGVEIGAHLAIIDALNKQIAALDKRIKEMAKTSEPAARLQKITGVGPIIALAFLAAVDDPKRFASGRHLASYVGLSPGENTTGGNIRRTSIIAAGQKQLRGLLVQSAHTMLNARKTREPMAEWALEIERRRGRKVAVCALARRLSVVMWAMLRDETRYDPTQTRSRIRPAPQASSPETTFGDVFASTSVT
jgi:transposase